MPTKYYKNNNKPNPYADIPVSIASTEDEDEEIICDQCRVINYRIRGAEYEITCKRCGHTLDVKREVEVADIVESESMDSHGEALGAHLPDANDAYHNRKKVQPQGAFSQLQSRGIRLTSYTERDGSGHVTKSYSDSSSSYSSERKKVSVPRPFKQGEE